MVMVGRSLAVAFAEKNGWERGGRSRGAQALRAQAIASCGDPVCAGESFVDPMGKDAPAVLRACRRPEAA